MAFVLRFWLEHGHGRRFWRGSAEEAGVDDPSQAQIQDATSLVRFIRGRLFRRAGVLLQQSSQSDGQR